MAISRIGEIRGREGEITVGPADAAKPDHPPETHGPKVRAAGRIVLRRPSGKVHWLQVRDWSGTIQVMIGKAQVGDENFALAQCLDLGDIVGVDGELKHTMKGELTIFAENLKLLSKVDRHAARETQGPGRSRTAAAAALPRSDPYRRRARNVSATLEDRAIDPQYAGRSRVRRGRRPDASDDRRRGRRPAVHHPPQRARHRPLPADRPGTASEAADGRRDRAGLRDGPRLSQRRASTPGTIPSSR